MADDELKTLVREFQVSVSADLEAQRTLVRDFRVSVAADLNAQHKRIDDLGDEVRQRITTAETAIVNEIRDMSGRIVRRLERVESRLGELEDRPNGSEG